MIQAIFVKYFYAGPKLFHQSVVAEYNEMSDEYIRANTLGK